MVMRAAVMTAAAAFVFVFIILLFYLIFITLRREDQSITRVAIMRPSHGTRANSRCNPLAIFTSYYIQRTKPLPGTNCSLACCMHA